MTETSQSQGRRSRGGPHAGQHTEPQAMVDRDRYPISEPGGGFESLARRCREQLRATGCCILPGFLTDDAVARALDDANGLVPAGHHSEISNGSAYLEIPDLSWPEGHARTLTGPTSLTAVAYDRFPSESPVRCLFEWDPLMRFLAAALGKERLYRYDDALGALNLAVMGPGDQLWWHFDQTDFVVSIALQDAEEGGDFEYAPLVRDAGDERYESVERVLRGDAGGIVGVPMEPGTLMLFEGRHSLHRVTPITGERLRLVALLAYDTKPGTCSSELLRAFRYGRTG
jgi:hypothetical protein